jgi:mannose-6-phosphate isomerase-like protein (cupin superfamily)
MAQSPPVNPKLGGNNRYSLVNLADAPSVPCPCGSARRAFQAESGGIASMHVVEISTESRTHYHKRMTEFYYVLEGQGQIELDEQLFDIGPGSAVMISPGCRHRAIGKLKILNVPVPAFDPDDEWFD